MAEIVDEGEIEKLLSVMREIQVRRAELPHASTARTHAGAATLCIALGASFLVGGGPAFDHGLNSTLNIILQNAHCMGREPDEVAVAKLRTKIKKILTKGLQE